MSYLVTARKWRPKTFDEVVGQQHITRTLKNAIKNNRIAHAFIFAGPRGVGKTTTARILAKRLNCLNPVDGEPCNVCEMCKSFMESQSLDIIEIDGASNRRIEEIRALRESVKYAPTRGSYKIYIIDEVHMLTTESFNALLKTLEEPPEHTIFIFATTDVHKVPLTIISRCQRFDFRRIEMNEIKSLLEKISDAENIEIDDESLTVIAKKADGALRDAQSLFDQVISFCGDKIKVEDLNLMLNIINEDIYFEVSDAILNKNFNEAFKVAGRLYENGWNYTDFLNGLIEHFRNILSVVLTGGSDNIESTELLKNKYLECNGQFSEGDLLRILTFLNKTQYELKNTQSQKLKIEIALSQLIGLEKSSTISALLGKLGNSEEDISEIKTTSEVDKKKTEVVNVLTQPETTGEKIETIHKSEELPISTPAVEPENESHQTPVEEVQSEQSSETADTNELDWKGFVEKFSSENFLKGSHLAETEILRITEDGEFIAGHPEPEDTRILNEKKEFYSSAASDFFSRKINLKFEYSAELAARQKSKKSSEKGSINPEDISDLGKGIIEKLGGKLLN